MKHYKFIITLLAVLLLPISVFAQLTITNVRITDAACGTDGQIEIVATGGTGVVRYSIVRTDQPGINYPAQESNIFSNLDAGIYTAMVYDENNPTIPVRKENNEVKNTYVPFTISSYSVGRNSTTCENTFRINCSRRGGFYHYKLINTTTNEEWEYTSTLEYETSYTFTGITTGVYRAEITDRCGTTIQIHPASDGSTTVVFDLGEVVFNTYDKVTLNTTTPMRGYGSCNKVAVYSTYNDHIINGSTAIAGNNMYWGSLKYRMEYPAYSGIFSDWISISSSINTYFILNNFDYKVREKFRVEVMNPCTGQTMMSQLSEMPEIKWKFTHTNYYIYDDLCSLPTKCTIEIGGGIESISSYVCDDIITITAVPDGWVGDTKIHYWDKTASGQSYSTQFEGLELEKKYTLTYVINGQEIGKYTHTTMKAPIDTPSTPFWPEPKYWPRAEYGDNYMLLCDFNTTSLNISVPIPGQGSNSPKYYDGEAVISMLKSPSGVLQEPVTVDLVRNSVVYPWPVAEYGDYQLEISYAGGCRKQIFDVNLNKVYYGFKTEQPTYKTTNIAGKYDLTGKAWYFGKDPEQMVYPSWNYRDFVGEIYNMNDVRVGNIYGNVGSTWTSKNIDPGDYYIKYYNSRRTDRTCYFDAIDYISIPEYMQPNLNIPLSGGITCGGQTGKLSILAEGTNPPLKVRYKSKEQGDDEYSAWIPQADGVATVINDLAVGVHTVQVEDALGTRTTRDITIYDGSEQFITLLNSFNDNTVCEGQTGIISVLSIGPVESYQWYKDGEAIVGATNARYEIPDMKPSDAGVYKIEVNTGACLLSSEIEVFVHPVLNMKDDYATVLPFEPQTIDIYSNDTFADCYADGCIQTLTADNIEVDGYARGVLEGDFGKIEIKDNKIEFIGAETYTKGVVKITYHGSCKIVIDPVTLEEKIFKGSANLYIYILQNVDRVSTVCNNQNYTVDFSKYPNNDASFHVVDPASHAILTLPHTYTNLTSNQTLSVTPKVAGYEDLFPGIHYTVYVVPTNVDDVRWKGTVDSYWNNARNWVLMNADGTDGNAISWVPTRCVNVELPTGAPRYPKLTRTSSVNHIWMGDRSMLAYIQKFEFYKSVSMEINFSATERDRWVMYSAPLKNMYSGDFMLESPVSPIIDLAANMSFFQSINPDDDMAAQNKTITRPFANLEQSLSIGKPFFVKLNTSEDTNTAYSFPRRDTKYMYYNNKQHDWGIGHPVTLETGALVRSANNEGRFITDGVVYGADGSFTIQAVDNISSSKVLMVTNPFTSYLNVKAFLTANAAVLEQGYYIWNGQPDASFIKYNQGRGDTWTIVDENKILQNVPTGADYIAPLQSFFVIKKGTGNVQLKFNELDTNTVEPDGISGPYILK